jgi:hypothetical protein
MGLRAGYRVFKVSMLGQFFTPDGVETSGHALRRTKEDENGVVLAVGWESAVVGIKVSRDHGANRARRLV